MFLIGDMDHVLRRKELSLILRSLPLSSPKSNRSSPSSSLTACNGAWGFSRWVESFMGRIFPFKNSSSAKLISQVAVDPFDPNRAENSNSDAAVSNEEELGDDHIRDLIRDDARRATRGFQVRSLVGISTRKSISSSNWNSFS